MSVYSVYRTTQWKYYTGTNIHKHALDAFYFDLTLQRPIQGSTPDDDVDVYTNGVSIMELLKIIDAYVAINNNVLDFVSGDMWNIVWWYGDWKV